MLGADCEGEPGYHLHQESLLHQGGHRSQAGQYHTKQCIWGVGSERGKQNDAPPAPGSQCQSRHSPVPICMNGARESERDTRIHSEEPRAQESWQ